MQAPLTLVHPELPNMPLLLVIVIRSPEFTVTEVEVSFGVEVVTPDAEFNV